MKVLELFAGSRSIGKVAEEMGMEVFSTDAYPFEGIDLVKDFMEVTPGDFPFIPDVIWASPPCTFFSVASIGKHWNKDHTPKTPQAVFGVLMVAKTLELIQHYLELNPNLAWFMENPVGKLRKLQVVTGLNKNTVHYCQYGENRMKPTDIWTNSTAWKPRPLCYNGNNACHVAAPRSSTTGTQGMSTHDKGKIPVELVKEILESVCE